MAEIATIARPYAEALFRVASAANSLTSWAELISEMGQAAQNTDVIAFVQNPKIPATEVADTFLSVLKSPLNQEAKNLISILASYHRLLLLPEIAQQFLVLKNAAEGSADALISSAFALSDKELATLCQTLETKFGRKLNPKVTVDPSLIGGVRVVVGDEVLDTSVRAKLTQMQIALAA
jgi:F-type H+-transporting ATPase subunit delta